MLEDLLHKFMCAESEEEMNKISEELEKRRKEYIETQNKLDQDTTHTGRH